jgi:hypothetical protein
MALYHGVLKQLSGGLVGTGRSDFTRREFIDIGDTHLRNVRLRSYHDELLRDAVGEVVTISAVGLRPSRGTLKTVIAIRTPGRGVVRQGLISTVFVAFGTVIVLWFAAIGWLLIGGLLGLMVSIVNDWAAFAIFGVAAACALIWVVVLPVYYVVRLFAAWSAIKRAPRGEAVDGTAALTP